MAFARNELNSHKELLNPTDSYDASEEEDATNNNNDSNVASYSFLQIEDGPRDFSDLDTPYGSDRPRTDEEESDQDTPYGSDNSRNSSSNTHSFFNLNSRLPSYDEHMASRRSLESMERDSETDLEQNDMTIAEPEDMEKDEQENQWFFCSSFLSK